MICWDTGNHMNCMNAFSSSHNPIRTINLYVNKMALADKLLLFLSTTPHVVIINIMYSFV